jgi:transcriptional regulator with XRE-family HTH domain
MTSFQITLTPSKRAAGRFVNSVRRGLQRIFAEEQAKRGLTQAQIAREIGVNRSVIHRELMGQKDITLGRVGELASAMGRKAVIEFREMAQATGNIQVVEPPLTAITEFVDTNEEMADPDQEFEFDAAA